MVGAPTKAKAAVKHCLKRSQIWVYSKSIHGTKLKNTISGATWNGEWAQQAHIPG